MGNVQEFSKSAGVASKSLQPGNSESTVLEVTDLRKEFAVAGSVRPLIAVNGISMSVSRGTITAIVGESGSGKSTLGYCMSGHLRPTSGSVRIAGHDMDWRRQRGIDGGIQMTFQDAFESFDPRWTVRHSLLEACEASGASWNKALVTLSSLGVSQEGIDVLPGGLSTGAQKVLNLVRAVVAGAQLLVADEPTSGLDLTARRRMASAMRKLAVDEDVTLVIISHDMAFVRHLTQNIHVMYLGDIVEQGPTSEVFRRPMHPYTKALLAASLRERSVKLSGEIPSPTDRSAGCPLAGRCPFAEERCSEPQPMVGAGPHSWACWKANAIERDAMTGGSSKPQ